MVPVDAAAVPENDAAGQAGNELLIAVKADGTFDLFE